jgi:hypothetical protein
LNPHRIIRATVFETGTIPFLSPFRKLAEEKGLEPLPDATQGYGLANRRISNSATPPNSPTPCPSQEGNYTGGGRGIRTPRTSRPLVFRTSAFTNSAIPPQFHRGNRIRTDTLTGLSRVPLPDWAIPLFYTCTACTSRKSIFV